MTDPYSEVINSNETDKELGMNFCERFLRLKNRDVRVIQWVKVDEKGHHHFFCSWTGAEVAQLSNQEQHP